MSLFWTFRGRATIGADSDLLSAYLQRLVADGAQKLLVNLANVTRLDSWGISAIIGTHVSLSRHGDTVKLLCPRGRVRAVLRVTRLPDIIPTFEDETLLLFLSLQCCAFSQEAHYSRFRDAKWYAGQIETLQDEIAKIDTDLRALVQARKSGKGVTDAVALDQEPEGAIQRILAIVKNNFNDGKYRNDVEAEADFRRLVEREEGCKCGLC
jgi:anti-anti-sigma factor